MLVPPEGSGWRGSTGGWGQTGSSAEDPDSFAAKYGEPLHVKRGFYGVGNQALTAEERDWIARGGILYFSVYEKRYTEVVAGKYDWAIDSWIKKVFLDLAPANIFITLRFEPDLYACEPNDDGSRGTCTGERGDVRSHVAGKYYGTPAEYRAYWRYIWQRFRDAGVTNAIWAMDYSVEGATVDTFWPLCAALWPGDGYVDWLFWNLFIFQKQRGVFEQGQFRHWVNYSYHGFQELSGVPQEWEGEYYTANYTKTAGWGLGAWGANAVQGWTHYDEPDRAAFLASAEATLNSGDYLRLKFTCYFDTAGDGGSSSEIGNATWRQGGEFSATPAVEDGGPPNAPVFEAYRSLMSSSYFAANDHAVCSSASAAPSASAGSATTEKATATPATKTADKPCDKFCSNRSADEPWSRICGWTRCLGCDECFV